jgi:hypothetical protein
LNYAHRLSDLKKLSESLLLPFHLLKRSLSLSLSLTISAAVAESLDIEVLFKQAASQTAVWKLLLAT